MNNYENMLDKSVEEIQYKPDEVSSILVAFSGKELTTVERETHDKKMDSLIEYVFGDVLDIGGDS